MLNVVQVFSQHTYVHLSHMWMMIQRQKTAARTNMLVIIIVGDLCIRSHVHGVYFTMATYDLFHFLHRLVK